MQRNNKQLLNGLPPISVGVVGRTLRFRVNKYDVGQDKKAIRRRLQLSENKNCKLKCHQRKSQLKNQIEQMKTQLISYSIYLYSSWLLLTIGSS